jgi:hypothetical protein
VLILSGRQAQAPAVPTVTYEARKLPPGSRAFVEPHGDELRMVCPRAELEPEGAARLTVATQRNIRKNHWGRRASGLLTPAESAATRPGMPLVLYEVDAMDEDEPVSMADGTAGGVDYVLVVIDENLCSEDGARYMTEAVAEHVADGRWQRGASGLWLAE